MDEHAAGAEQMLLWGVKASLLRYIGGLPDGRLEVGPNVDTSGRGIFGFPLVEIDSPPDAPTRELKFGGGIRLRGHGGMLDIAFVDPWIRMSRDDTAVPALLSVSTMGSQATRLPLALLLPPAPNRAISGAVRWEQAEALLTAEGVELFGGQYAERERLDPVTFTVADVIRV